MLHTIGVWLSLALVALAAFTLQNGGAMAWAGTHDPVTVPAFLLFAVLTVGAVTGASYGVAAAHEGQGCNCKGCTMTNETERRDEAPSLSFEEAHAAAAEAYERDLANNRRRVGRAEADLKRLRGEHDTLRGEHEELRSEHEDLKGRHRESQEKLSTAKQHLERAADLHKQGHEAAKAGLEALRGAETLEDTVRH
mgnify:CR=1 FL=1